MIGRVENLEGRFSWKWQLPVGPSWPPSRGKMQRRPFSAGNGVWGGLFPSCVGRLSSFVGKTTIQWEVLLKNSCVTSVLATDKLNLHTWNLDVAFLCSHQEGYSSLRAALGGRLFTRMRVTVGVPLLVCSRKERLVYCSLCLTLFLEVRPHSA